MAAAVVEAGSVLRGNCGGGVMVSCRLTTAANGEDGVTWDTGLTQVKSCTVSGAEAGADAAFVAVASAGVVTIDAAAGATGDAKLVSVQAVGY